MTFRSDLEALIGPKTTGTESYDKSLALYCVKALEGFDIGLNSPDAAVVAPPVDPDPPASIALPDGWINVVTDNFTRPAGFGADWSLDPTIWKHRNYGTGAAHGGFGVITMNGGNGLEATGSTLRVHVFREGTQFKCDGFQQGAQNVNPAAYGYHPGYHEFQVEFRFRYSHYNAKGVGGYVLMWPASNEWSSELDFVEMPGEQKNKFMATQHWDSAGTYDLGVNNDYTSTFLDVDLTLWHVVTARRTYAVVGGDTIASLRIWLDGVEIPNGGEWINNSYLDEPMVFGAATFAAAGYNTGWFSAADGSTPADSYMELDYVKIWTPPEGGAPPPAVDNTITITPSNPGSRAVGAWPVTIASGVAMTWVVMNADFSWTTGSTDTGASGSFAINPVFTATGQQLRVWETLNTSNIEYSVAVTIV